MLREQTDYFVVMRMVASHGPFQTACDLRGMKSFLVDLASHPDFAHALLNKITTAIEGLLKLTMQAGGKYFDMIELPGDDYAGNLNPMISPAMFCKFIKAPSKSDVGEEAPVFASGFPAGPATSQPSASC